MGKIYTATEPFDVPDVGRVTIRKMTRGETLGLVAAAKTGTDASHEFDAQLVRECVVTWPDGPPDDVATLPNDAFEAISERILTFSGIAEKVEKAELEKAAADLADAPTD